MKTRLIKEIGVRAFLRIYWDGCSNCCGTEREGYHNTMIKIEDRLEIGNYKFAGRPEDYPEELWPKKCDHCGSEIPANSHRQVHYERLYNTVSGKPEIGDVYENNHKPGQCFFWGEECDGIHINVVLPNGNTWDINSRASNCTKKEDNTHRCWCKHGELDNLTIDKNGNTCQAGGGSIISGNYHGFLINGELVEC